MITKDYLEAKGYIDERMNTILANLDRCVLEITTLKTLMKNSIEARDGIARELSERYGDMYEAFGFDGDSFIEAAVNKKNTVDRESINNREVFYDKLEQAYINVKTTLLDEYQMKEGLISKLIGDFEELVTIADNKHLKIQKYFPSMKDELLCLVGKLEGSISDEVCKFIYGSEIEFIDVKLDFEKAREAEGDNFNEEAFFHRNNRLLEKNLPLLKECGVVAMTIINEFARITLHNIAKLKLEIAENGGEF